MTVHRDVALITGASSGIGREMARMLAAREHDLVLVGRSTDRLEELAEELTERHRVAVHCLSIDLAERGSALRVLGFTRGKGLEVAVLINNAGVGLYGEHTDLDPDELERMLQLNVVSLCGFCRRFGEEMKRRKRGRILNIASTAAYQPTPYFAAYGASKSFVLHFSEALAKELEEYGVTVSCLSPGPTDTGFFRAIDERGTTNACFGKKDRCSAKKVAAIGIEMRFEGRLSRIVGAGNYLRALSGRFASRAMVANVSKRMMKPR